MNGKQKLIIIVLGIIGMPVFFLLIGWPEVAAIGVCGLIFGFLMGGLR